MSCTCMHVVCIYTYCITIHSCPTMNAIYRLYLHLLEADSPSKTYINLKSVPTVNSTTE